MNSPGSIPYDHRKSSRKSRKNRKRPKQNINKSVRRTVRRRVITDRDHNGIGRSFKRRNCSRFTSPWSIGRPVRLKNVLGCFRKSQRSFDWFNSLGWSCSRNLNGVREYRFRSGFYSRRNRFYNFKKYNRGNT